MKPKYFHFHFFCSSTSFYVPDVCGRDVVIFEDVSLDFFHWDNESKSVTLVQCHRTMAQKSRDMDHSFDDVCVGLGPQMSHEQTFDQLIL